MWHRVLGVGRCCLLSLGNVIFGGRPVQRASFYLGREASTTRIFYLFDVSVPTGVQRDSVGRRFLLSLGNVIFGGRPVQRASFIFGGRPVQRASFIFGGGLVQRASFYLWRRASATRKF